MIEQRISLSKSVITSTSGTQNIYVDDARCEAEIKRRIEITRNTYSGNERIIHK